MSSEAIQIKPDLAKYQAALKKVSSQKTTNYIIVEVSYDKKLVMPYEDGIAFLNALSKAELLNKSYGKPSTITNVTSDILSCNLMSQSEYQRIKIAQLLQINSDELEELELQLT